jgi:Amt family ammonium transporter
MTFAIITPALITGGLAERMKFSALLVFMAAWSLIVYCPIAHSVWATDGFLRLAGILDFAGGTVVHISSGFAALVASIVLGKRHGHGNARFEPHNVSISLIGASLLWVGWFGFNAGSAVAAGMYAGLALSTTQIATGAAGMSWMLTEWALKGKPTVMSVISGAVAGLVSITPACGFVDHNGAIIMGFIVGIVCSFSVQLKHKLGYDDALDAFGVHGVGGVIGGLLTGLFASPKLNNFYPGCPIKGEPCDGPFTQRVSGAFYDHLLPDLYGATNRHGLQLGLQFYGIIVTAGWSSFCTYVLLKIIDKIIGLRVDIKDEVEGLDASVHGETVYYGSDDMKPPEDGPKIDDAALGLEAHA